MHIGFMSILFDTYRFLWRFIYLCGVSSAIGCQQRTIFCGWVLFKQKQLLVHVVVMLRSQRNTFSFIAVILANYGFSLRKWLSFSSVDTYRVQNHYVQFGQLCGFPRHSHLFLKLIWFACVWTIWKENNNRTFNNKVMDLHQMIDKVKLMSFMWLKANMKSFAYNYHEWWCNLLSCTGITLYLFWFFFRRVCVLVSSFLYELLMASPNTPFARGTLVLVKYII